MAVENRGQWQKGQSSNPKGRPRNERALANVLRETGEHDSFGDLPNKAFMARLVWQAIATGEFTLAGGRTITLSAKEWLDLVKWLNFHVDGSIHVQDTSSPKPDAPDSETAADPSAAPRLVLRYGPKGLTWAEHVAEQEQTLETPSGSPSAVGESETAELRSGFGGYRE